MSEPQLQAPSARLLAGPEHWRVAAVSSHASASASATAVVIGVAAPAMRCGLESMISATAGLLLMGSASKPGDFLQCCDRARDGVALLDPFLGGRDMRVLLDAMKAVAPRLQAVLMTDAHRPQVVRDAVKTGVRGLVTQGADIHEIRDAIQAVAQGQRYFSPAFAAHLAESLSFDDLTPRETQVLALLSKGACNKRIARDLDVAVGTVKTHVASIMCKLDSRSRTEAVLRAGQLGLVHFA